jgi:hypothetical protein
LRSCNTSAKSRKASVNLEDAAPICPQPRTNPKTTRLPPRLNTRTGPRNSAQRYRICGRAVHRAPVLASLCLAQRLPGPQARPASRAAPLMPPVASAFPVPRARKALTCLSRRQGAPSPADATWNAPSTPRPQPARARGSAPLRPRFEVAQSGGAGNSHSQAKAPFGRRPAGHAPAAPCSLAAVTCPAFRPPPCHSAAEKTIMVVTSPSGARLTRFSSSRRGRAAPRPALAMLCVSHKG